MLVSGVNERSHRRELLVMSHQRFPDRRRHGFEDQAGMLTIVGADVDRDVGELVAVVAGENDMIVDLISGKASMNSCSREPQMITSSNSPSALVNMNDVGEYGNATLPEVVFRFG